MKNFAFILTVLLSALNQGRSQSLIINEVSNGPSGSKEYIELMVVDTVAYSCSSSTPPCIDIRNWIIDDNSGYHSIGTVGTGVAPGCNRFSNDTLWSCVPLGTIIVLYNNTDPNANLPTDDISLSDGNCVLIVPINHPTLMEGNSTTPGAAACSYPTTGWVAGGNWNNIGMANSGDCARIVDLAGCEVFSVCWGNNDQNNVIYFSGAGSDDVWFFNDSDPNLQTNWTEGCTDIAACGSDDQTPGVANNAANASYEVQFNNGCAPITPIIASAIVNNGSCPCSATADASATGSIAGYTYDWFDAGFTYIGQDSSTAVGLCDGMYYVIATSSIGCEDTAVVTVLNGTLGTNAGTDSTLNICDDTTLINLFDYLGGTPDINGTWNGPSALTNGDQGTFDPSINASGAYDYTISGGGACPDSTATITINIEQSPNAGSNSTISFCALDGSLSLYGQLSGSPQTGGIWNGPSTLSGGSLGTFDPSSNLAGTYTYMVTGTVCPNDTSSTIVTVNSVANASIDPIVSPICRNALSFAVTTQGSGGIWSASCGSCINGGLGVFSVISAGVGQHEIIYSIPGACGDSDTAYIQIDSFPIATLFPDTLVRCPFDTATVWASGENLIWFDGILDDTVYVLQDSGDFYVTANNACGSDTVYTHIIWTDGSTCGNVVVEPYSWMLFPNIITNNNDGVNDFFSIKEFYNITDLEVHIFNRWGLLLGQWEGTDGYWTGYNLNNDEAVEGTYFYTARAIDWKGEPYNVHGHFTLVR